MDEATDSVRQKLQKVMVEKEPLQFGELSNLNRDLSQRILAQPQHLEPRELTDFWRKVLDLV